jgi:hypothetical protein
MNTVEWGVGALEERKATERACFWENIYQSRHIEYERIPLCVLSSLLLGKHLMFLQTFKFTIQDVSPDRDNIDIRTKISFKLVRKKYPSTYLK